MTPSSPDIIQLHRTKLLSTIMAAKPLFFGCIFKKKDGTMRKINAFIPKPLENPKRPAPAKLPNSYLLVCDMKLYIKALRLSFGDKLAAQHASYRLINLQTVTYLSVAKQHYQIID